MKLAVYNGSPRGTNASSHKLAQWSIRNSKAYEGFESTIYLLNEPNNHKTIAGEMENFDSFLFIFPLYVDSVPGIVKAFFEEAEYHKQALAGKSVYFIIHSGFPELIHSRSVSRYVRYYTEKIMDMRYMGTGIIGFSELIRQAPDQANYKKLMGTFYLQEKINNNEPMGDTIQKAFGGKEKFNIVIRIAYRLFPFKDLMWKREAKSRGAKNSIYARPYAHKAHS